LDAGTLDEALRLVKEHPGEIHLLISAYIYSAKSNDKNNTHVSLSIALTLVSFQVMTRLNKIDSQKGYCKNRSDFKLWLNLNIKKHFQAKFGKFSFASCYFNL
jgi:hypothetical protein